MPAAVHSLAFPPAPALRRDWAALVRLAVLLFVPTALAVSLLAYVLLRTDVAVRLEKLQTQEEGEVKVAANLLEHNLEDTLGDLRFLSQAPSLQRYLDSHAADEQQRLSRHFISLAETKTRYDQVRLLDRNGIERIRVNLVAGKAVVVPASQLQDKSGRYFFTETMKLRAGEIYISPFDLNIEHGQVEVPFKPTLRIAAPLFDRHGQRQGILILNYLGQQMLDDFTAAMGEERHAMLLNRDGYWIRHPQHEREWGFMFGNEDTFAKDHPAEWAQVSAQESGRLLGKLGLLTYATVHPLHAAQTNVTAVARDYYWKIVSQVSPRELPAITPRQYPLTFTLYLLTLVLLATLAIYVAAMLRSRQQLSQAIYDNEARLHEITSTLAEGLYVMDDQGLTTYVNPEAERLLGWRAEEMIGKSGHDLFHHQLPDGTPLPASECAINCTVCAGQVYKSDTQTFWRRDGTPFPVEVSASPIVRDGKITGAVIAFSDISQLKQDQQALRNSAAQLLQAQQLAEVGSWELDLITKQLSWSDEIYRIFEIDRSAFGACYEAFINLTHPEDRARVEQAYSDSVSNRTSYNIEHRLLLADGRIKHVVERGETIYDENGRPLRSIGTVQDITERKAAQEALRRSNETARALLNANTESAILIDTRGTVLAINRIGAQRLRKASEELLNRNLFDLFPPELQASRRKMIETVVSSGEPLRFQDQRNGIHLDNSLYPIFDKDGQVQQIAVYSVDITERVKLEAEEQLLHLIDQQVLHSPSLSALLQLVCDEVVGKFGYPLVWLGKKESDGSVSISALAGRASAYVEQLQQIGVRWDDTPLGHGPAGAAIRQDQPQIFHLADTGFQPWHEAAEHYGFQAIAAFPVVVRNQIYGTLLLYCEREHEFDDQATMQHLSAIAGRICVAVEMALDQQQLRLLSSALASAGNAIFITDPKGRIQWVNQAFTRLTGYNELEAIGHTPSLLKSGKQDVDYYRKLWNTIQKGKTWSSETVERHKSGMLFTVQQTITPILSEAGEITHFISILDDISAQKEIAARIQHMAHYDALTNLPNRVLFYDRLHQLLMQSRRDGHHAALMFLDLDRFKAVNDTLGHHVGDLLLQEVAQRIKACVRESDTVARLAGDEFTVLLPNVHTAKDVAAIAEKIITSLAEPFLLEGHEARIGTSIGIAFSPTDADTDDELIKCADKAMYQAKEQGRGTYRFYAPEWR